ncbi:type IV toxin-antitoxin system AbiEi family antitoxin domain-containing protein, partial [Streptomyces sp. WAC06614]|uniref:type IV toxin-antitoxin system AbiEi family antitoxin domain-containing protein n=1 Tax=Streptomyces sp. WAC06614 TaxID=2487416 RepID=UPI000F9AC702
MASIRGGVFTRADARACGYVDADIDSLLGSGAWRRIRRGTYAAHRSLMLVTDEVLYLRRIHNVLRTSGPTVFASHQSAAALHALPVWGLDLTRVHLTAPDGRSGRARGVHRHIRDPVGPGLQLWNKLRMVSPARAIA